LQHRAADCRQFGTRSFTPQDKSAITGSTSAVVAIQQSCGLCICPLRIVVGKADIGIGFDQAVVLGITENGGAVIGVYASPCTTGNVKAAAVGMDNLNGTTPGIGTTTEAAQLHTFTGGIDNFNEYDAKSFAFEIVVIMHNRREHACFAGGSFS